MVPVTGGRARRQFLRWQRYAAHYRYDRTNVVVGWRGLVKAWDRVSARQRRVYP
jgi:hypothetical protein